MEATFLKIQQSVRYFGQKPTPRIYDTYQKNTDMTCKVQGVIY
jgi:hypothetical protein